MSSSRVQSSFIGTFACFAIAAASAMYSVISRRPKPPPERVMWTVMSVSGMPNVRETSARPAAGDCVGAHSSSLPPSKRAVQFCGSIGAWAMNG